MSADAHQPRLVEETEVAPPGGSNQRGGTPPMYGQPGVVTPDDLTELIDSGAQKAEESPMAWLVVVTPGPQYGELKPLLGPSAVIGRAADCEIVIRDDSGVSRQHAKIWIEHTPQKFSCVLHDLATRNGTFVNGSKHKEIELKNGDTIRVGRTELVFKSLT